MKPTAQQAAFLKALVSTKDNLALVARAGTGKTSTILMGVDAYAKAFPQAEICVCAYNKAIAVEVKDKLIKAGHTNWKTVQASTIHAMGNNLVKFIFKPEIKDDKVRTLVRAKQVDETDIYSQYEAQIISLVRVAKQAGVGFFDDAPIGNNSVWYALADHYDINGLEETDQMDTIVTAAQGIYRASLAQTNVIDFDDMILFPLVKNLSVKFGKDLIFLDEAQDLSRARQALAKKFLKRSGRMVIVGDDRQAIYGFSGADSEALTNLQESMRAVALPLSVTWRCPLAVVQEAQKIVPDIEAAPDAKMGSVITLETLPEDIGAGDAILCRNTAPLIKQAYRLIRQGKACKVEGRAIGEGLIKMVTRWKVKTIDALIGRVETYREREIQKAVAKGQDQKAEDIADKCDTLLEIATAVTAKGGRMVSDIVAFINALFADSQEGEAPKVIILATYHRSKGREWNRVYLFEHSTRCPSKAARQDWQKRQEANLAYVAITRAKDVLAYVG